MNLTVNTSEYVRRVIDEVRDLAETSKEIQREELNRSVDPDDLKKRVRSILDESDWRDFLRDFERGDYLEAEQTLLLESDFGEDTRSLQKDLEALQTQKNVREGLIDEYDQSEGRHREEIEAFKENMRRLEDQLESFLKDRIRDIPGWNGSSIIVEPRFEELEFDEEGDIRLPTSFQVYVGEQKGPSFTLFYRPSGMEPETGDVLPAGQGWFDHPETREDYYSLVREIDDPGSNKDRAGEVVTLYTARPSEDRQLYRGSDSIPTNVYLTTSRRRAEGYAREYDDRDVWRVRIKKEHLTKTEDQSQFEEYQVTTPGREVPVESIRLIGRGKKGAVEAGTFWHGTSLENLSSIMEEGLIGGKGSGWTQTNPRIRNVNDLFLTGNRGKAVQYAARYDDPVVLKIRISTPDRLNQLKTDIYDDPDLVEGPGPAPETLKRESPLFELRNRLEEFAEKRGWPFDFDPWGTGKDILPAYSNLDDQHFERVITQINLYREVKDRLHETFDKNRADNEYDLFLEQFRPGQYGEVHLRENGSLRLDSSYWDDQHQIKYPDDLPPAAIKEVWLEASTYEEVTGKQPGGEKTETFYLDRLPSIEENIWKDIKSTAMDEMPDAYKEGGVSRMEEVAEETYDLLERQYDQAAAEFAADIFDEIIEDARRKETDPVDIHNRLYWMTGEPPPELGERPMTFAQYPVDQTDKISSERNDWYRNRYDIPQHDRELGRDNLPTGDRFHPITPQYPYVRNVKDEKADRDTEINRNEIEWALNESDLNTWEVEAAMEKLPDVEALYNFLLDRNQFKTVLLLRQLLNY